MIGLVVGCSLQVLTLAMIVVACFAYRRRHTDRQENAREMTNRQSDLVYLPSL